MFNIKKMNKKSAFIDSILSELHEIKCNLANDRPFEGGVGLGGIMNFLCNELEKSLNEEGEEEQEDEEVQDEECEEECEDGSEEEDPSEEECHSMSYYRHFRDEREKNITLQKRIDELEKKTEQLEKTSGSINETKRCIFELQDLLMRLIKFRKINLEEVENVINILRNTGVDKSDISVICKGLIQ